MKSKVFLLILILFFIYFKYFLSFIYFTIFVYDSLLLFIIIISIWFIFNILWTRSISFSIYFCWDYLFAFVLNNSLQLFMLNICESILTVLNIILLWEILFRNYSQNFLAFYFWKKIFISTYKLYSILKEEVNESPCNLLITNMNFEINTIINSLLT